MFHLFKWGVKLREILSKKKNSNVEEKIKPKKEISEKIEINLNILKKIFDNASDLVIREFNIRIPENRKAAIVFIDGIVDKNMINENIMNPLMADLPQFIDNLNLKNANAFSLIKKHILSVSDLKEVKKKQEIIDAILSGDTALFIDGYKTALLAGTRNWEARDVEEPDTEAVVRGPKEGFTETLRVNTSQIRRKIKNPNLKFEMMEIGIQTRTSVCIAYIKGIVNEKIVEEIRRRLKEIKIDSVLESGYLEQLIEDEPLSFFPTIGNTEKPDVAAAKILEGRIAIITDGTPFVLTAPYLFIEAFQSSEDYYSRPYYSTLIRWIRYISFLLSTSLPAIYIALTTYHQEMIPTALLNTMAAAKEGTPFPAVVEALGMGVVFEILREAGVRMPRPIGQAVSIVGALVVGEAAVSAGLIGAPMVIVVAITAISGFVVASISDVLTISRLILTILASIVGLFGIVIGFLIILTHMVSIRSFGVPYLSPLSPLNLSGLKDLLIRAPLWSMKNRPTALTWKVSFRREGAMPGPEDNEED